MCWVKLSFPSNITLTNTDRMVVLVNRQTGNATNSPYAYLIQFNASTGNLEFQTRGTSATSSALTLVARPFLDRWYHVAIVRAGNVIQAYVDGEPVAPTVDASSLGNTSTTDGVSIGGWTGYRDLLGEVEELRIFQTALDQPTIQEIMFEDLNPPDWSSLTGYYKFNAATSQSDSLKNYSQNPSADASSAAISGSGVTFPQVDEAGEQSVFDAQRNGGRNAIAPLSGAFIWQRPLISRPTKGLTFDFSIGYSSVLSFNDANPLLVTPLGHGWRHSLEARVILPDELQGFSTLILSTWDGDLIVWDLDESNQNSASYIARDGQYHGELQFEGNNPGSSSAILDWITPDRKIYRFHTPFAGSPTQIRGRLMSIADFAKNQITIFRNITGALAGEINKVTDTAGGTYQFTYNPSNQLTQIALQGTAWTWTFTYGTFNSGAPADNLLTSVTTTGPPSVTPLAATWNFNYLPENNAWLIQTVQDPLGVGENRGSKLVTVAYDTYGRKSNVTDVINRQTVFQYNQPATQQTTVTDARGNNWITTYDRSLNVTAAADPAGNTTNYTYDSAGDPLTVTDALGHVTQHTFDTRSNTLSTTDALGNTGFATYPDDLPANAAFLNSPLTTTDALGWMQNFQYDPASGKLLQQSDQLGNLTRYIYTPAGQVQTMTDANGQVTTYTYTPEGFLASRLDPGLTTASSFTYTDFGWIATATDPLGQATTTTYDINGNPVSVVDTLGRTHTRVFDPNGNLVEDDDFKGKATTYTYDDANQRTGMTTRDGKTWSYQYTPTGKLAQTSAPATNPGTPDVINTYDNADRLVKVAQTDSGTEYGVQTVYDAAGNAIKTIDRNGQEWDRTYDALNRVTTETDPNKNTESKTYDADGRILTIVSPTGNTQHHTYDGRGRLATWQDGEGGVWAYAYDGNANILQITDALNGHYTMTYGPRSERLTETNQDNKTWTYAYDALLRPATETDPNGRTKTNTYDPGNRVMSVAYSTGRTDVFGYDPNNNLKSLTRTGSGGTPATSLLDYDAMDRAISYQDPYSKTVGFAYDALGRRTTLTYPDGKQLSYSYDALGRLANQTDWASRQLNYTYDNAGRLLTRTYPNGVNQTNGYDNAGRLTLLRYSASAPTSTLLEYDYAYDQNNNLASADETGTLDWTPPAYLPNETSTFTGAGRLTTRSDAADTSGQHNWVYSYDNAGNMINAARNDGAKYQLTYDEQNRTTNIQWTPGQPGLSGAATTASITNRYDALGRRVSRTLNGTETRYTLDLGGSMERTLCDTDSTGKITAWYVHGPDLCYKITLDANNHEVVTCYHADTAGNVVMLTGNNGAVTEKYAFTPYGRLLGEQATGGPLSGNPYRFAGSQGVMEELPGLSFMRARYYLAEEGVFLSTDPVKKIGPGWMPTAYSYVSGNPAQLLDPMGLFPWEGVEHLGVGVYGITEGVGIGMAAIVAAPETGVSAFGLIPAGADMIFGASTFYEGLNETFLNRDSSGLQDLTYSATASLTGDGGAASAVSEFTGYAETANGVYGVVRDPRDFVDTVATVADLAQSIITTSTLTRGPNGPNAGSTAEYVGLSQGTTSSSSGKPASSNFPAITSSDSSSSNNSIFAINVGSALNSFQVVGPTSGSTVSSINTGSSSASSSLKSTGLPPTQTTNMPSQSSGSSLVSKIISTLSSFFHGL